MPLGLRSGAVNITGTVYVPPAGRAQIAPYLDDILKIINDLDQAVEKAMARLMLLPYPPALRHGNKRTSRLVANAPASGERVSAAVAPEYRRTGAQGTP